MPGSVNVRLKTAAFFGDLSDFRQGEHLKSAAVSKDRPVPILKLVQPSHFTQDVKSRTKVEMIGVAKDDLGLDVLLQVPVIDPFDRADSPNGHKYRSPHLTVIGGEHSCPRP